MSGPGVAPARIPEIDDLCEAYVRERDKRVRQTPKEVDAKKALISSLHAHEKELGRDEAGVLRYKFEGFVIELRHTEEKLSVRKADEDDQD
jgi:hypothetical protein